MAQTRLVNGERVEMTPAETAAFDASQLPRPLYQDAVAAKTAMVLYVDALTRDLTGNIPADEKLSWPVKDAAARAYKAGIADAMQVAIIEAEADITGEAYEALAEAIISKADLYRSVVARITGLRRKTEAAIDAVSDPHDYETVLNTAMAEAEAARQALGI